MQPAIPRYTQRALPRYRYLPNAHPHPVIHPEGHSFQKPEEKSPPLVPEKWMQSELYLYGIDLYNHGYWWEAHEAWETVWLTTQKTDLPGLYLQGLIQFSAALLKLFGGSKKGFDNLLRESHKKFERCSDLLAQNQAKEVMGLALSAWLGEIQVFCKSLQPQEGEAIDPLKYSTFPALLLVDKAAQ